MNKLLQLLKTIQGWLTTPVVKPAPPKKPRKAKGQ